ncbi:glycosyltransferase family 4 protein [Flavobacterium sp. CYK-55]|uniref:glycosyltransferase family 4 protein n=1 Tax=Flavobacterium sp. CYK-55 TaxID=2835529 RepID=UPI001BD121DE|nr:glycosyltransferase family 4 protein [Flavobacterium sp. CYK-55]MBS7786393.1 glycosyltransferase family 4 protein [Flavobacterium sp. CYK-55]
MKPRLLYIGNKLSKHGITVTSIETLGALLESEGYDVIYASSVKNKTLRLIDMLIKTFYHRNQVDFVLIDTYSTHNFWYAFLVSQLCRLLRLKYIPKLHGGDLPNRLKRSPVMSRMIFKNAYCNVAPSAYLLEAFSNKGYATIHYIPNTIELENYPFKKREQIKPRLLWVRSFASIYNPGMAIEVYRLLKNEFPDAALCMVGPDKDGSFDKVRQMAKKLNLDVFFTGKLSKKDWIKISEQYDIFINTTHFDNTPVSVIEAMALGLPIVSTNVGGITYLLDDQKTALLVSDSDAPAMIEAVKKILTDKALLEHLVHNAQYLVQDFDWTKVKTKWNTLLH